MFIEHFYTINFNLCVFFPDLFIDTQVPTYIIKTLATEWIHEVKEEQELCIFKVDNGRVVNNDFIVLFTACGKLYSLYLLRHKTKKKSFLKCAKRYVVLRKSFGE